MRSFIYAALAAYAVAVEEYDPNWEGDWSVKDDDWDYINSQTYEYEEVDDTTTTITNIYDNKSQKIDQIEIEAASNNWAGVDGVFYGGSDNTQFFEDLLNIWRDDAYAQD